MHYLDGKKRLDQHTGEPVSTCLVVYSHLKVDAGAFLLLDDSHRQICDLENLLWFECETGRNLYQKQSTWESLNIRDGHVNRCDALTQDGAIGVRSLLTEAL